MLGKPWKIIGASMFSLYDKHYIYMIDYHSKFIVIKKTESLLAYSLILTCKVFFFSEYGLPKKIISAAGGNFVPEKFKEFCKTST